MDRIHILYIISIILLLLFSWTYFHNSSVELKYQYNNGYMAGKLFTDTELKNCYSIMELFVPVDDGYSVI